MLREANELVSTDPNRGEAILQRIASLSDRLSNQQRYRLQILQAKLLVIHGQYGKALTLLEDVSAEDLSVNSLALSNSIQSTIFNALGEYDRMFAKIQQNLALVQGITDISLKAGFMHPAIVAFRDAGAYEQSLTQGLQMLKLARENAFSRSECFALVELGITERSAGNRDAALDWLRDAEAFCSDIGNKLIVNSARANLAALALDAGDADEAIAIALAALPDAKEVGYAYHITELKSVLAEAYLRAGDLDKGLEAGEEAFSLATESAINPLVRQASKTLADIHERRGDLPASLAMLKIHLETSQLLADDRAAMAMAYYQNLYEVQDKERRLQILNQENDLFKLSQQLQEQNADNMRLLLLMGFVVLIGLSGWLFYVMRQRQRFLLLSQTDGMTGIANREHFSRSAEGLMREAATSQADLGLILFDLDHFKTINDSYGHAAGDWVLKKVVAACRTVIRRQDLFGRLGGEEFGICLLSADLGDSLAVAEACRLAIRAIDTSELGHHFTITASFGIAIRQDRDESFDTVLIRADQCLYSAKSAGRDQTRYEADAA
ncbi:GGDEF domain-containing protein [Iodidimonas nitroreducens]|uniref:diguanylate cyclase n=2 Tax=Iodidimonas nitroreducens TaxID=1236968 RepID=A0A5A7NE92_9PROT|nr:GGDEF domain-containing protein [Iodidimonas nitroreducens]